MFVLTMNTPCSGCLVEVTNGPGTGLSATTLSGRVTLQIPESGTVTVRASKEKYRPATTTVLADGPNLNPVGQVSLEPAGPTIDVAGERLVEVRAAAVCNQLPAEFRVRSYPVSFRWLAPGAFRSEGVFRAEPIGGAFDDFYMWVVGLADEAAFAAHHPAFFDEAGIVERLPDGGTLYINLSSGVVPVANPDETTTAIGGTISYCGAASTCMAECTSTAHQLRLTRR